MASVAHILETALLLLAAFLVGGGLGHWSRHLLAGWRRNRPAESVAADPATTAPPAAPVPATSLLGRVPAGRNPTAAAASEEAPPLATASPLPAPEPRQLRPARVAGEVFSGGRSPVRISGGRSRRNADLAPIELAAMQAVEGDWSPPSGPAPAQAVLPPEPAMMPADDAEAAMAGARAAVAAASAAAEAALAAAPKAVVGEAAAAPHEPNDAGRPPGLPAPWPGGMDDLSRIAGITARHAAGLHALGIFHFDQIARWTDRDIDWIETHLRPEARVRRDRWAQQAQALAGKPPVRRQWLPDASSSP